MRPDARRLMSAFGLGALVALAQSLSAEQLVGHVLSEVGEPIEGAVIAVVGGELEWRTGEGGEFTVEVELPARLRVRHPEYEPLTLRLTEERFAELHGRLEIAMTDATVRETLLVTAEQLGDRFSPNSVSSATFDPLDSVAPPTNLAEAVTRISGVSENGQGGLFQVFSVRGISRQRLLSLFSGARLTSERRAGVSSSFVDPSLIGEVSVLRGPASTYYGSGALGGAVQIEPRWFDGPSIGLGYDSRGDETSQQLGWGNQKWSLGVARRTASDSKAPDGETLFSRYNQISATVNGRFEHGRLASDVLLVSSYGDEIGKPNTDYPTRSTLYPRERHTLLRYSLSAVEWRLSAFVHPHRLKTEILRVGESLQTVDNEAFDFGGGFVRQLRLGQRVDGRVGVDFFARSGVDARQVDVNLATQSETVRQTLAGAREREAAGYGVVNWEWRGIRWEVGARGTLERQSNGPSSGGLAAPVLLGASETRRSGSALTGFFGVGAPLTERVQLVANMGTGFRFPSLTEQFFTGTTGRGEVIGNPGLEAESSLSGELGLRWFGERAYVGATAFRNRIDDYIERVEIAPDLLTFRNLTSGTLEGVEVDGFVDGKSTGSGDWRLLFAFHALEGESSLGGVLVDVPADELRLGGRWTFGRWRGGADLALRGSLEQVGPGEKPIPSATILAATIGYRLGSGLELSLVGRNLLDESYFPSADDKAVRAAARSVGLSLRWTAR